MAVLYTQHFVQFFDDNGNPLSGGRLYTYDAGGTTPKATYSDAAGTVLNANPVVLDAAGRATVFLDGTTYRFDLKTAGDVLVRSTDNVQSFGVVQSNIGNTSLAIMPANSVKANTSATSNTPSDLTININSFLGRADGNITNIPLNYGRNKIINGKMDLYQRGSSFANPANAYTLDRWNYGTAGTTGVVTVSAQSDVPSSNEFQTSLRVLVTTADTTQDAGDVAAIWQRIEGTNARDLIGKTFTLSFWVRSAKTGIHCTYFKNGGSDRSYVIEYNVNAANTWEYKTVTVTGGLITAGTWNWTTGVGLEMGFTLMAGSSNRTTANAWQTGNFLATNNQVNVLDAVNNIFAITGVQLEEGNAATPFEHRLFGQELSLCQRYYERGFALGTNYSAGAGNYRAYSVPFSVTKRAIPTMSATNIVYGGAGANTLVIEYVDTTMHSSRVTTTSAGSFIVDYNWQASSEL